MNAEAARHSRLGAMDESARNAFLAAILELHRIQPALQRMRREPAVDPGRRLGRFRRNSVAFGGKAREVMAVQRHAPQLLLVGGGFLRAEVAARREQAVAVARHDRIEVNQVSQAILGPVGHPGNHHSAVGMAHQHHLFELLPLQHVRDVGNVRVQPDAGLQQMGTLAATCERGREHLVPPAG